MTSDLSKGCRVSVFGFHRRADYAVITVDLFGSPFTFIRIPSLLAMRLFETTTGWAGVAT
jgi:hypothetical protein